MGHHNNNYSKFFKNTENEKVEEVTSIEEFTPQVEKVEDFVAEVKNLVLGFVSGCEKLYVRKEASKESASLCVINKNTEVTIDETESTEDFYKVCTAAGIEGYCMKKFISIK